MTDPASLHPGAEVRLSPSGPQSWELEQVCAQGQPCMGASLHGAPPSLPPSPLPGQLLTGTSGSVFLLPTALCPSEAAVRIHTTLSAGTSGARGTQVGSQELL